MGAKATIPQTSFGQRLRQELDQRGWGVRTLAREMAARSNTPARVESIRRQLKRYLSTTGAVRPSLATRRSIEEALGLEHDSLPADDDEESDPVLALVHVIRRLVRDEIRNSNEPSGSLAGTALGSQTHGG